MLRSSIYQFEALTDELLSENSDTLSDFSEADAAEKIRIGAAIADGLKNQWLTDLFGTAKDPSLRRYVQYHQTVLTGLSNRLYGNLKGIPVKRPDSFQLVVQWLLNESERLIRFLKERCYQFFDHHQIMTKHYSAIISGRLTNYASEIAELLKGRDTESLIMLIQSQVGHFAADMLLFPLTYSGGSQAQSIIRAIRDTISESKDINNETLFLILYHQNFNAASFVSFSKTYLSQNAAASDARANEIAYWQNWYDRLYALQPDQERLFDQHQSAVNLSLLPWVKDQVNKWSGDKHTDVDLQNEVTRLNLTLSVPQFALYIRLFHLTGCFASTNVSDLQRFFIRHFATKRQASVSVKSFAKAFYNVDQTTAATILDQLRKMELIINKTYFN